MKYSKIFLLISLIFLNLYSVEASACACGCGVLNVGTSSLIPNCEGGVAFVQYDQMNQSRNWSGDKKSDGHNHDKRIDTQTITAGAQYMFNRSWGASIRVPYVRRYLQNVEHHEEVDHHGDVTHFDHTHRTKHGDIGDIRINAIYSGFFDDMSTGLTFGLKLPTGSTSDKGFSRSAQIGSGSTNAILGAYHMGTFGENSKFGYFAQGSFEKAFITRNGYNPGYEISAAAGVYYDIGQVGMAKKVAPIFQITTTKRGKDSGFADPHHNPNSGYNMVFFAPGIEISVKQFKIYADVSFPVYRYFNGNQLAPQNLYKVILGYNF